MKQAHAYAAVAVSSRGGGRTNAPRVTGSLAEELVRALRDNDTSRVEALLKEDERRDEELKDLLNARYNHHEERLEKHWRELKRQDDFAQQIVASGSKHFRELEAAIKRIDKTRANDNEYMMDVASVVREMWNGNYIARKAQSTEWQIAAHEHELNQSFRRAMIVLAVVIAGILLLA